MFYFILIHCFGSIFRSPIKKDVSNGSFNREDILSKSSIVSKVQTEASEATSSKTASLNPLMKLVKNPENEKISRSVVPTQDRFSQTPVRLPAQVLSPESGTSGKSSGQVRLNLEWTYELL